MQLVLHVLPSTTRIRTCLAANKVARLFFVGGKTRNSHIQLVLEQCCTLHVFFVVVVRFTAPLKPLIVCHVKEAGGRNMLAVDFFSIPKNIVNV